MEDNFETGNVINSGAEMIEPMSIPQKNREFFAHIFSISMCFSSLNLCLQRCNDNNHATISISFCKIFACFVWCTPFRSHPSQIFLEFHSTTQKFTTRTYIHPYELLLVIGGVAAQAAQAWALVAGPYFVYCSSYCSKNYAHFYTVVGLGQLRHYC
jgi:hypothetical protein